MDFSFPHYYRIKKRPDFLKIQAKGNKLHSRHLLIIVCETSEQVTRIGITISKKIDKRAVKRNRVKRLVREVFRLNRHLIKPGLDIVVVGKKNILGSTYAELEREFVGALKYHKYLL